MAWIYCQAGICCQACSGGCRPLVDTETDPAIHAWRGSTGLHPRMAWIYCQACFAAKPALVGADRWSALKLTQPSTHGVDLLRAIHAWRGSTERHPRMAWIYWTASTHGVDLLRGVHAWRGSTALLPPGTVPRPAAPCRWSSPLMAAPCPRCRPGWGRHRSLAAGPILCSARGGCGPWPAPFLHPRKAWIYCTCCLPASARACGNWKALLTS